MNETPSLHLIEILADIAVELSPEIIEGMADAIRGVSGVDETATLPGSMATPRQRASMEEIVSAWTAAPDVRPESVAFALEASTRSAGSVRNSVGVELIWTGPTPQNVAIRRTDQALFDLLAGAERSLTLVTFAAYKTPRLSRELASAAQRDVRVRLILESKEEGGERAAGDPIQAFDESVPGARVYVWPDEKRERSSDGRYGVLHTKCVIADGARAFVSSANLTGSALELNMELGVLITGGEIPLRIDRHFDGLIQEGVLELAR